MSPPGFRIYGSRAARARRPNGKGTSPQAAAAMLATGGAALVARSFPDRPAARRWAAATVRALIASEGGAPTCASGAERVDGAIVGWVALAGHAPSVERLRALLEGRP